jgi:tetratricopeptide (TPR) repeat protein
MAISLNPQYAEAYVELGRAREQLSDFDRAIQINPNLTRAYYWRARVREKLGSQNSAHNSMDSIFDYAKALSLNPRYGEAYLGRGQANRKMKEYAAAIADLTRAIQLLPKQAEAYEERGLARLESGDESGALEDFVQIIRLAKSPAAITPRAAPTDLTQHAGRYVSHLDKLKASPALAKAYYEEGMAYHYVGDKLQYALTSFKRAIELNLNTPAVYYQRSLVFLDLERRNEAIEDLTKAIQLAPAGSDYYYARGRAYFDIKDFQKASADFSEAIRLSSKFPDLHFLRGRALYHFGDKAKAIADFTTSISADPQAAVVYLWRGLAFEEFGETARAAADYIKVTEIRPLKDDEERIDPARAFVQIDYLRGRARLALIKEPEKFDENDVVAERTSYSQQAVYDFSRYLRANPVSVEAYFWRARAQKFLLQKERAYADLTQAMRLQPAFILAYLERARISPLAIGRKDLNYVVRMRPDWARGYYERARHLTYAVNSPAEVDFSSVLTDLNRAIEIDPKFVDAYRLRASIKSKSHNDVNGAMEDLNQVIRYDPDDLYAYEQRADLRLKAKDYRGAVEDFSRTIELALGASNTGAIALRHLYSGRSKARYEIGDGIGSHNDNQQVRDLSLECRSCHLSSNLAKAKKADTVFQKGLSLALRGDTTQARNNFEEALRLYGAAGKISDCEKVKNQLRDLGSR